MNTPIEELQQRLPPVGLFPNNPDAQRPPPIPEKITKRSDTKRDSKNPSVPKGRGTRNYFNTIKEVGAYVRSHNEDNANIPSNQYRWYESHLADEEISETLMRIIDDKAVASINDLYGKRTYNEAHRLHGQRIERLVHNLALHPMFDPLTQTQRLIGIRKILMTKMRSKRRSEIKKQKKNNEKDTKESSGQYVGVPRNIPGHQTVFDSTQSHPDADLIAQPRLQENNPTGILSICNESITHSAHVQNVGGNIAVGVVPDLPNDSHGVQRSIEGEDSIACPKEHLTQPVLSSRDTTGFRVMTIRGNPVRPVTFTDPSDSRDSISRPGSTSRTIVQEGESLVENEHIKLHTSLPSDAVNDEIVAASEITNKKVNYKSKNGGKKSKSAASDKKHLRGQTRQRGKKVDKTPKSKKMTRTAPARKHRDIQSSDDRDLPQSDPESSSSEGISAEIERLLEKQKARREAKKSQTEVKKRSSSGDVQTEKRRRLNRKKPNPRAVKESYGSSDSA